MMKKHQSSSKNERHPTKNEIDSPNLDISTPEALKHRHFSDNPEDIFNVVKELEDRFTYTIKMTKDKYEKDLQSAQVKWAMAYQNAIKEKKTQLEKDIEILSSSIDEEIESFNSKEKSILNSINNIAQEEESSLVDEIMALLGFEF